MIRECIYECVFNNIGKNKKLVTRMKYMLCMYSEYARNEQLCACYHFTI